MSFNSTDITNGVSISGSASPFNTYIKTENAGVYDIQFSAQVDKTDGGTDDIVIWLRKNGIDLTDTATTLTLPTNNSKVVAAWNWFVSSATGDYYQIIWRSADTDLRLLAEPISIDHPGIPSVILTVNRVDQFLSNTGSFSGSFTGPLLGTASYATQALSASYATTASYVLQAVSASYATTALSASYAPVTPTFPYTGSAIISGSLIVTGSITQNASTASFGGLVGIGTTTPSSILHSAGSITASGAIARGNYFNNTLVAAANNDVLVGVDIQPTFTNGAFTGVDNFSLRINGGKGVIGTTANAGVFPFLIRQSNYSGLLIQNSSTGTNHNSSYDGLGIWLNYDVTHAKALITNYENNGIAIYNGTNTNSGFNIFGTTNNIGINTTTDAGYKLDVNGTARIQGNTNVTGYVAATSYLGVQGSGTGVKIYGSNNNATPGYFQFLSNGGASTGTYLNYTFNGQLSISDTNAALGAKLGVRGSGTTSSTTALLVQNSNASASLVVNDAGNTLIGTATDAGFKLNVSGSGRFTNGLTVTGSVIATSFTGSLLGTASYATQALSASYAPSTPAFPYNGNAQISGSLGVTGSFTTQTYDGTNYVPAISIGNFSRAIYDVMGTSSFDADSRDLYDSSAVNSISWESRRLLDSAAVGSIRWDLRSTYDTVDSQSIAWGARLLKIDNGPASYTVDWGSGILRDTNAKNSVDWQNRTTIDTNNKKSIDWENRKLLNTNETELLNWQNQITITGPATVSGSLELTGSFKMLGAYNGFAGPFKAIEIDDVNFIRQLFDVNAGVVSVDFGDRSLNTAAGGPAISWQGGNGTYQSNLYESQYIDSTTRNNVFGFNALAGQVLGESYFDINVMDNDLVYLETDGLWYQVNQTTDTSTKMLAIAKNLFSQTGSAFIEGDITVTTGTGYPQVAGANYGLPIYIKQGAGTAMDTTIPTSGYVRLLGYCYHNPSGTEWIMKFRPSHEWYLI
jgi:hypothetical protein